MPGREFAGEMSSAAGLVAGNPGWASTGASTTGSSAVESAKAARQAHADGSGECSLIHIET